MTDQPYRASVTDILHTPAFDEAYLELTRYAELVYLTHCFWTYCYIS